MGDEDFKRKRYCLICNVFKPERCHHCSACNRCVLNMDHHCPWINNCIGFWNRKHFILLLIYTWITSIFTSITMALPLYDYLINVLLLIKLTYRNSKASPMDHTHFTRLFKSSFYQFSGALCLS